MRVEASRVNPLACVATLTNDGETTTIKGVFMSIGDKAKHAAEDAVGHIKEGVGKGTGNEKLEAEGRADQAKADLKKAGDSVKDAFDK